VFLSVFEVMSGQKKPSYSLQNFESKLTEFGLTFTKQRRAIAEVLIDANNHPDIDEIYLKVKAVDKTASIATVYRNISLFTELGLVVKREFNAGKSRYECKSDCEHNHIILEDGEIIEFESAEIDDIIKKIVSQNKVQLQNYTIEIRCKK